MSTSATTHHVSDTMAIATLGNIHMAVYRGRFTVAELGVARDTHLAIQDAYGTSCLVSIGEPGTPLPGSEARLAASRLTKELGARVATASMILDGTGFWASAARSATTAIFMVAGNPYPIKVFPKTRSAVEFIWPSVQGVGRPDEVVQAIGELRATRRSE